MSTEEYEDVEDVPLHHMKPFGSGLRRNEIKFVPASTEESTVTEKENSKSSGQNVRDFYLNMVLKKPAVDREPSQELKETNIEVCEICKLPLTSVKAAGSDSGISSGKAHYHEASIAHQVCLAHSHPPSALDRNRMGLSVLEAAGWDPDSRTGLGAAGQGVQYPIKVKPKEDRLGVGVVVPKDFQVKKQKEKPKMLDAKKVRKMAADDRKRTDKLQQQIFGKVDLEKYLGKGS
ncbi:hypothetical protein N0V93_004338 [Gnomoniopsis smithogilvyi]|uniref:G-patch domain-containing protein n=1 Tax=Gnomoniopsis smithogilvyi TaxID=1191159 RepID=A0A9W9CX00_9PEZI|nr:hypothetical protein N0V93_004338 [Gnomoniopsis smithogilvyi]